MGITRKGVIGLRHRASIMLEPSGDDHKRHSLALVYKRKAIEEERQSSCQLAPWEGEAIWSKAQTLWQLQGVYPMRCHLALLKDRYSQCIPFLILLKAINLGNTDTITVCLFGFDYLQVPESIDIPLFRSVVDVEERRLDPVLYEPILITVGRYTTIQESVARNERKSGCEMIAVRTCTASHQYKRDSGGDLMW